jgi:hypothetical protein
MNQFETISFAPFHSPLLNMEPETFTDWLQGSALDPLPADQRQPSSGLTPSEKKIQQLEQTVALLAKAVSQLTQVVENSGMNQAVPAPLQATRIQATRIQAARTSPPTPAAQNPAAPIQAKPLGSATTTFDAIGICPDPAYDVGGIALIHERFDAAEVENRVWQAIMARRCEWQVTITATSAPATAKRMPAIPARSPWLPAKELPGLAMSTEGSHTLRLDRAIGWHSPQIHVGATQNLGSAARELFGLRT